MFLAQGLAQKMNTGVRSVIYNAYRSAITSVLGPNSSKAQCANFSLMMPLCTWRRSLPQECCSADLWFRTAWGSQGGKGHLDSYWYDWSSLLGLLLLASFPFWRLPSRPQRLPLQSAPEAESWFDRKLGPTSWCTLPVFDAIRILLRSTVSSMELLIPAPLN